MGLESRYFIYLNEKVDDCCHMYWFTYLYELFVDLILNSSTFSKMKSFTSSKFYNYIVMVITNPWKLHVKTIILKESSQLNSKVKNKIGVPFKWIE